MEITQIALSKNDKMILDSYKIFIEGLSQYLGNSYEIVLHSLENLDHSVIKIINGYHTGRTEGAPITNLALQMLTQIQEDPQQNDAITYFSKNKCGEPLKSTTITIRGENYRIIGLICINFYMNSPFYEVLNSFYDNRQMSEPSKGVEHFSDNINDVIFDEVQRARNDVNTNLSIHSNLKNKAIIEHLYKSGIFNLKDSVIRTAELLNISKNTVYMHLRNLKEENENRLRPI